MKRIATEADPPSPDGAREPGRRLRIALFSGNFDYTPDGSNRALQRLVEHLVVVHGWEVRIYSPARTPAPDPAYGRLVPIPSVAIPLRTEYRLALGLTDRLRQDLMDFAPDVLHLSSPDPAALHALRLARLNATPVVTSVHTRFETYLPYYGLGALRPMVETYLRSFYARCDYVLAPSHPVARELFADSLNGRLRIWSRGVDRTQFDPNRRDLAWRRRQGFLDDDVVVLFFGRVVREKGLRVFAEATRRAHAADRRIRPLVVGDGPHRAEFARQLTGAVFTGALSGQELGLAVASADLMLNPSTTETFGNVTLEAMAAGLPVVCADAAAHRALAGENGEPWCVPDNARDYAAALVELAADPERRLAMGRAGRRSSETYDWPTCLEAVAATYREAVASGPVAHA